MDVLTDPFALPFMQRALLLVLILSVPAGVLGAWVVMRRLSFATHAVGHATFPALVVAYVLGWSVGATALVSSVMVAVAIALLGGLRRLADGVAVGVVLSAAIAVGAVLVSDITDPGVGADSLLFGSVLGVQASDVVAASIVAAIAMAIGAGLSGPLAAMTFDPEAARGAGIPARALDIALMAALGATVAVGVPLAGSLMISGLLLLPAATARLVTERIGTLIPVAITIAAMEGAFGLWLSYRIDAPPGATVALVAVSVLLVVATARTAAPSRNREAVRV